ncbi:MAG: GAF domain-containing sensor histidine kinase [Omnitrophica WOR_2 bacterium]
MRSILLIGYCLSLPALFAFQGGIDAGVLLLSLAGLLAGLLAGTILFKLFEKRITRRNYLAGYQEAEKIARKEQKWLHSAYNSISALTASLRYQQVLESVLDLSSEVLGTPGRPEDYLVSAVLIFTPKGEKETELYIGSGRGLTASDLHLSFPGNQGILKDVLDNGEACLAAQPARDVELGRLNALQTCQSGYVTPLRTGLDAYGVLLFSHPDAAFFTAERQEILDYLSHQASTAIQNARLYNDLKQEKERISEIQEEMRKKLARDLHDGPTQSVAALAMRVNFARRLLEKDIKAASAELVKIEDLARRTTKEIRHMLFILRPLILESQGLIPAFETMADKMREMYNQNILLGVEPEAVSRLETGKQGVIFYIVEEAINNARKHARAEHVWVRLKPLEKDFVLLEIRDDGVGFNLDAIEVSYDQRNSLGLVNMRERAELISGLLRIESSEGKGTCIQVVVPTTEEAAERLRNR